MELTGGHTNFVAVHFQRVADDNDMPTVRGMYRRVRDYWDAYTARKGIRNTYWAEICCPGCGKVGLVGSNNTVDDNGVVMPSDICPFPPCTFHQYIVLDGWSRPSTPRR